MRGSNSLSENQFFLILMVVTFGCLLVAYLKPLHASEPTKKISLSCAPDSPIAHPGETITVNAWIGGSKDIVSENIEWHSSVGKIKGTRVATWTFPKDKEHFSSEVPVTAEGSVKHKTLGQLECQVRVYFVDVPQYRQGPNRHRLSGRAFLLPGKSEPERYGLYSYLLFGTPPGSSSERERYLKAIEAYLQVLQSTEELESHRDRGLLNITLIPLIVSIDINQNLTEAKHAREFAIKLLKIYNFAQAQSILSDLDLSPMSSGPMLVSKRTATKPLVLDMDGVEPDLVRDWVKAFCQLAAQKPSWAQENFVRLALQIRNVISVTGKEMPKVLKVLAELDKWIGLFEPRGPRAGSVH